MKIYTRTGDKGMTSLIGGKRISKDSDRIEALGTLDELNSYLGLCAAKLTDSKNKSYLSTIQEEIFKIGAVLAIPEPELTTKIAPAVVENDVKRLESEIDEFTLKLKPLKNFILPGGDIAAAHLFIARSICRRAERNLNALTGDKSLDIVLAYVNRLSDWLFTFARYINKQQRKSEQVWIS